ncbi:PAS domain S-box-containing protein [Sphingomonas palmae]|uniref:histidine kinase n=1 Tax=Sphingomonas palmae TaxID=1855283 RepID=A0A1H7L262_9SPHN|nr:ATP-binding protein [Sphingomonas palmae]SEK92914.1 PAS domain S-box-containing protein [Sphingomonas palmae]
MTSPASAESGRGHDIPGFGFGARIGFGAGEGSQRSAIAPPRRPARWRMVAIALLIPALLATLAWWNVAEFSALEQSNEQTRASFQKRVLIYDLFGSLEQAETAQRGFILTGNAAFMTPYEPAKRAVTTLLSQIDADGSNTPVQHDALRRMKTAIDAKIDEMDAVIALRRRNGLQPAINRVAGGDGRALMEQLRRDAAIVRSEEERISDAGARAVKAHVASTGRVIVLTAVVAVALFLLALVAIRRQRQQRYRADVATFDAATRYRSILDGTIDPIVILNPSGTIELINRATEQLLGFSPAEVERRDVSAIALLPNELHRTFPQWIGLRNGAIAAPYRTDIPLRHRDGHTVTVDAALGVMKLADGEHVVVSLRDVSARKRSEAIKDELISTISHELRTPLTSVVGALGLLRAGSAGDLPDAANRLVGIAESNARRLIRLINDMLDLDRMQSNQLQIERVPVDLAAIAARACDDMQGAGSARDVTVRCNAGEQELTVLGDADRLMQVIGNLVSNAVRVSPPGRAVTVSATRVDGMARVMVDDEGPGIPTAFRERLFRRFERANEQQGTGTGLGLAISREIIQRHDGRIWFEDRPGGGTRFAFSLELAREAGDARVPDDAPGGVLVCSGDAATVARLSDAVAATGRSATVVASAHAAHAAIAERDFDALLLDLKLPDGNGFQFAQAVRRTKRGGALPIVIVSATARGKEDVLVPFDLVDWIPDPIEPERLDTALRTAIARTGTARPTILHLDDDRDLLDVTAALLRDDARLITVSDLPSARAVIEHAAPALAILDLHLVEGTGLDLLPALVDRNGVAIPTILYSAHDIDADMAARVDAVLIKSRRSLPDLRATIRHVLAARRA